MPNMPCYNDIAARNHAAEESAWDDFYAALEPHQEEAETWTVNHLRDRLKPHECEALDEIISSVAERMLKAQTAWHNEP